MNYLLLLFRPEDAAAPAGSEAFREEVARFEAFHAELARRGIGWEGHPLQPSATATSVRVREGRPIVSDGPFAETKEQLGGYYLMDLPSLQAAVEVAAMVPWARAGTIEVRPVASLDRPEETVPGR